MINPNDIVTVTELLNVIQIQHMSGMNTKANIKKLDKDRYMNIETGEIKEYNHIENRSQSYNSMSQTMKKIRELINNNFQGKPNELFLTLTYKENMTDTKRLYSDTKRFLTRFKRKYTDIDYFSVIEPQERGAWHIHMLIRFNRLKEIFIPSKEIADMWEQGFVKIKSMRNVDNIGAYLSAYLGDIEVTGDMLPDTVLKAVEEKREIVTKEVEGQEKKFIKGGRLHMYPPGMNIFRKSKGIVYPEKKKMSYKSAKKIVGSAKLHYEKNYDIDLKENTLTLSFEEYKK